MTATPDTEYQAPSSASKQALGSAAPLSSDTASEAGLAQKKTSMLPVLHVSVRRDPDGASAISLQSEYVDSMLILQSCKGY